jgi:hypothetical protein
MPKFLTLIWHILGIGILWNSKKSTQEELLMSYINYLNDRKQLRNDKLNVSIQKFKIGTVVASSLNQSGDTMEITQKFKDLYFTEYQATCATEYFEEYLKKNFTSFENHTSTGIIKIDAPEVVDFLNNFETHLGQISKDLCLKPSEAINLMSNELEARKLLIKPVGISGVFHKTQLLFVGASSSIYSSYGVAMSSMTGTTGLSVLHATPLLCLTVPTLFGIGFGACERVFYGSPAGNVSGVLKTAFLTPLWCTEHLYNNLVSPVFSLVGVDAPLNFTSYLKYGVGILPNSSKKVMSTIQNPKFWDSFIAFFKRS